MRAIRSREVRVVEVETQSPSPFASSLLFGYVAQFLYEGDSPLAERRAAALALDTGLLAELLGQAELRELLDADAVAQVDAELQRLVPERHARDAEGAADLLRLLGPLTAQAAARPRGTPGVVAAAGEIAARDRGTCRGAGPGRRGRGRRAAARRPRHRPAGRAARRVPRTGRRPRGRPDRALRPHPRPVPRRRRRDVPRSRPRGRHRGAGAARGSGPGRQRRVPPRRQRHRVVRRRGAAPAAAPLHRPAATRGRAGAAADPRHVPARVAARRRPAARHRRGAAGRRAAGRLARTGVGVGVAGAARPRAGLRARDARRADRRRRGRLGRCRGAARLRRLGRPAAGRRRTAAAARARTAHADRHAPRAARGAGRWRRVFFRALAERVDATDGALAEALWDLAWAGHVTGDTLTPLRALVGAGRGPPARRIARPAGRTALALRRARARPGPGRAAERRRAGGRCCPTASTTRRGGPRRSPTSCSTVTGS